MNISWSDCDVQQKVDCVRQSVMTNSGTVPIRSSKVSSQRKFAPKKGHVHCLVACCPSDPLQLSEFWWNHYIWEVCSANWCDALKLQCVPPALVNRRDLNSSPWQCPTAHCTTNTSKVEWIGLQSFASSAIFIWPLTYLSLLQASWQIFAVKTIPQLARGRKKCFPRVCRIPKHRLLCYRNKQIYFSLAKMCWLQWFLFWLIKMCLSLVTMI